MAINESIVTFITVATSALSAPYALTPGGQVDVEPREPVPPGKCALATPRSTLGPRLEGCTTVFSDTAAEENPAAAWGPVECEQDERERRHELGGDRHSRANGVPQADSAFRRITVLDGDDFYGERCELGQNDHREGPTALYSDGERRATYASVRLARDFPLGVDTWQNVLQMKQAQPSDGGGGTPVLSLKAFDGRWQLFHSGPGPTDIDLPIWSTPARTGVWTRFALDVLYSIDSDVGSVKVYADLNGDTDFSDWGEQSPTLLTNTLKYETAGGSEDGYAEGEPLASHLRAGIYHDSEIDCPEGGCRVDLDNVQVLAP